MTDRRTPERLQPGDPAPSKFTRTLIDELAKNDYQLHAWRTFMSQSWARSLGDIRASPSLTRSFLVSAGVYSVAGISLVLLSWWFHPHSVAVRSLAFWLPWYAASVAFVLTHLGMADSGDGVHQTRFLAPNQLSFMRLALAPLVVLPGLAMPAHPVTGPVFALFIGAMSMSDALDGWAARRRGLCTRLGQMLDYLADLAFLTFLSVGLYLAAAIPGSLLWLLLVRYPLTVVGAMLLYLMRGPATLNPTFIGRATTLATSIVLLLIAFNLLLGAGWPPSLWVERSVWWLQLLIGANIVYLIYRGVTWGKTKRVEN